MHGRLAGAPGKGAMCVAANASPPWLLLPAPRPPASPAPPSCQPAQPSPAGPAGASRPLGAGSAPMRAAGSPAARRRGPLFTRLLLCAAAGGDPSPACLGDCHISALNVRRSSVP